MDTESPIVGEHEATALLVELEGMGRGLWLAARLARTVVTLYGEVRKIRAEHAAALATARREGAEEMREVVKAEIYAAFHYNDPPDDGVERPIAPRAGEWEAHQTLRKLLLRVCALTGEES